MLNECWIGSRQNKPSSCAAHRIQNTIKMTRFRNVSNGNNINQERRNIPAIQQLTKLCFEIHLIINPWLDIKLTTQMVSHTVDFSMF